MEEEKTPQYYILVKRVSKKGAGRLTSMDFFSYEDAWDALHKVLEAEDRKSVLWSALVKSGKG
jgi:hypothetical protein